MQDESLWVLQVYTLVQVTANLTRIIKHPLKWSRRINQGDTDNGQGWGQGVYVQTVKCYNNETDDWIRPILHTCATRRHDFSRKGHFLNSIQVKHGSIKQQTGRWLPRTDPMGLMPSFLSQLPIHNFTPAGTPAGSKTEGKLNRGFISSGRIRPLVK